MKSLAIPDMFRSLSLRAKILALPVVAAIGFLVTLGTTIVLGRQAQAVLASIRSGYSPALEHSRTQLSLLESYQRALRDAVGASDSGAIAAADSMVKRFAAVNDSLARNVTTDSAAIAKFDGTFREYSTLAKLTSIGMISGSMEDLMGGMQAVKTKYAELSAELAAQITAQEAEIEKAYASADRLQSTSFAVTSAVLVIAMVLLGVLAWGTLGSVIGAMRTLSNTGRDIARGKLDVQVDLHSKDEIGELAEAFRGMLSYIGGVAQAADKLATGDLSASVEVRSEHDVLSRSINGAAATLQKVVSESNAVIDAAKHGELSKRGNPALFEGAYAQLIAGTNEMLDSVVEPIAEAKHVLARVAARDLSARVTGEYVGEHADIKESLNSALENIAEVFASLTTAISQVNSAAREIGEGSQELASGAADQAGAIDQVSHRVKVVDDRTKANVADANEARAAMERASVDTEQGVERMTALAEAIAEIKRSADSTAKIVKTIDEIAFQTNLLALNAAVEAARAGDAGKGFAVVADEVRSLAIRASEASRNTAKLIEESVQKAETGVKLNESVTRRLHEIRTGVQRASTIMINIAEGAAEQQQELAEVNSSMDRIAGLTQRTAANAEESASAAAELSAQAAEMQDLAAQFDVGARQHRSESGLPVTSASRRQTALNVSPAFSSPRPSTSRSTSSVAKPAAKAAVSKSKSPARLAGKSVAKARVGANSSHVSDDVFPMRASAMIPFDDDDNGSDDILGTF